MESSAMLAIFTQHVHVRLNWLRSGHDRWRHLAFAASPLMANGLRCQRLQRHMPLGPNTQLCGPKSEREWREGRGSWSRSGRRSKSRSRVRSRRGSRSRNGTRSRGRSWSCCWSRSLPLAFIKRKFMPLLKCQILQMSNAEADPGPARWVPPDNPRAPVPQLPACYCCCCCGNTVNAACLCPVSISIAISISISVPVAVSVPVQIQFGFSMCHLPLPSPLPCAMCAGTVAVPVISSSIVLRPSVLGPSTPLPSLSSTALVGFYALFVL